MLDLSEAFYSHNSLLKLFPRVFWNFNIPLHYLSVFPVRTVCRVVLMHILTYTHNHTGGNWRDFLIQNHQSILNCSESSFCWLFAASINHCLAVWLALTKSRHRSFAEVTEFLACSYLAVAVLHHQPASSQSLTLNFFQYIFFKVYSTIKHESTAPVRMNYI